MGIGISCFLVSRLVTSEGAWGPQMEKYFEKWSGKLQQALTLYRKGFQEGISIYQAEDFVSSVSNELGLHEERIRQGVSKAQHKSGSSSQSVPHVPKNSALNGNG